MNKKSKLTIAIITMNRCEQVLEALESCLACDLPAQTEFVILDNASTDGTGQIIEQFAQKHSETDINYYYSEKNLGVGGGRSRAFEKANGEYVYFLDDDAVIDPKNYKDFFVEPLDFLDRNTNIASITTQICDEVLGFGRTEQINANNRIDGKPLMFFYYGGSHFLRKACFDVPLYFPIQYGAEEYAPSICAMDKGYAHVFDESVQIIHKPKVNKWVDGTDRMRKVQICGAAVVYATKRILYPWVFHPILWAGYTKRCSMYLKEYPGAKKEADQMAKTIICENKWKKIRFRTVINMYRNFGMTVF